MLKPRIIVVLTMVFLMLSCTKVSVKQIGSVNMISNRNVDSNMDYILLRTYMGLSEKEKKNSENLTIQDALDHTVKNTPGGEFLKNAKIYLVTKKDKYYFAAEGDVWGREMNANYRGFKVGDKVQWKFMMMTYTGVITNLKDSKICTVKDDDSGKIHEVEYEKLLKIGE